MIIELCGLPGVGKTTLAKTLEKELGYHVVLLERKRSILYYLLKGLILHPILYVQGLWWCLRHNQTRYFTWNFFCIRYAKLQKAFDLRAEQVVLDEGPLTNIISYSDRVHQAKDLEYFYTYAQGIDSLVCVSIPESERQVQILKRDAGQTNRRKQSNENREQNMLKNAEQLQSLCGVHPKGRVVASSEEVVTDFGTISETV